MATKKKAPTAPTDEEVNAALATHRSLAAVLMRLSEQQLMELLVEENAGKRRKLTMERIHQRLTRVRSAREREELKGPRNG